MQVSQPYGHLAYKVGAVYENKLKTFSATEIPNALI